MFCLLKLRENTHGAQPWWKLNLRNISHTLRV